MYRQTEKDIRLKVVKTSSRFSIYFQLHFASLLGVFGKCFSVNVCRNSSNTQKAEKISKPWKPECKCGLLYRNRMNERKMRENPIKLFIAFRFVRFFLITILTFQLFPFFFFSLRHPIFLHVHFWVKLRAEKRTGTKRSFIGFSRFHSFLRRKVWTNKADLSFWDCIRSQQLLLSIL